MAELLFNKLNFRTACICQTDNAINLLCNNQKYDVLVNFLL